MSLIDRVLRIGEGKILRKLEAIGKAVNAYEDDFVAMSDERRRSAGGDIDAAHGDTAHLPHRP